MKKKVLSVLIALVMIFGLLPTMALAEGETVISQLTITDVVEPVAGKNPVNTCTLGSTGYSLSSLTWWDLTANHSVSGTDSFVAGHQYRVSVFVDPAEGYIFAPAGNMTATINGASAEVLGVSGNANRRVAELVLPCAVPEPEIWVGGVGMIDGDYLAVGATAPTTTMPASSGYAYYKDGVLTLHNYTYEGSGYEYDSEYDDYALIFREGDLALVLEGTNVLTAPEDLYAYGIYVQDLVIREGTGGGSITITVDEDPVWAAGDLTIESGTITAAAGDDGLYADDHITITGGSISVHSGDYAICASAGRVTISGGQVTTAGSSIYGYDHSTENPVDILIEGGRVTVDASYYGLRAGWSDIVITGGYVDVMSRNTDEDDVYYAVLAVGSFTVAEGMTVLAATEPHGTFVEYVPEDHESYDHIKITPKADIHVGGVGMIDGDYLAVGATAPTTTMPASGGYAYYKDGVLTLHNYTYEGSGYEYDSEYDDYALIFREGDLALVLEGTNVLTAPEDLYAYGIYVQDLVIREGTGGGSITITVDEDPVWAAGDLTIESGTITAAAGDDGLYADDHLTISGGTVAVTADGFGIYADGGSITITGGTVTVTADEDGICADYGRVTITGGVINITADDDGIYGYDEDSGDFPDVLIEGGTIDVTADTGICADLGDAVITGGSVTILAGRVGVEAAGLLSITGGSVSVVSQGHGIMASDAITLTGGTVTVEAEGDGLGSTSSPVNILGGKLDITAGGTGIGGYRADDTTFGVQIGGGTVTVSAGAWGLYGVNSDIIIYGGKVDVKSTNTEQDATYYAAKNDGRFLIAEGVLVLAATEPDGTFVEYVPEDHNTYDHLRIDTPIWVGGVKMFDGDYLATNATETTETKPESGGYAYYKDGVLTLHDYTYEGTGYEYDSSRYALIIGRVDLTVLLEGTNSLTAPENTSAIGIHTMNLVIREGTAGGSVAITTDDIGIGCDFSLTIDSGTFAVDAYDGIWSDNGTVTIYGGEFDITGEDDGIYADSGINIHGGNLVILADYGIYCDYGRTIITGGALDITAESMGIYGYDARYEFADILISGGNTTVSALEWGLCADLTDVVIRGGKVDVKSTNTESDDAYYAISFDRDFVLDEVMRIQAATEPDGTFVEYVAADHETYDHIKLEQQYFIVTFDPNGGSVAPSSSITGLDGTLASLPTPSRGGYFFNGWFTEASGGTQVTTDTVFTENTTIYAQWTYAGGFVPTAYDIIVETAAHGGVTSSHRSAPQGTTITLTISADSGYVLKNLIVLDSNNKEVPLTKQTQTSYTFLMPASRVTVRATFAEDGTTPIHFTDVLASDYFYDAVQWAAANGITNGTGGQLFSPNLVCTRAQAVTFLWRTAGSPEPVSSAMPFTDVAPGTYYYKAVLWAAENRITEGTSPTTFSPNANCTRAQIITLLWRSHKSPSVSSTNPFTDVATTDYYYTAVLWGVREGITVGTTATTFSPNANCTRAQIVTFLWRATVK